MSAPNPYAPPKAVVADVVGTETAPPLWNPNAAASWSLLFSPIFGSYLHMRNWQALGESDKAAKSRYWFISSILLMIILTIVSVLMPESTGLYALARTGGFILLIAWYYGMGKSQQQFVVERFGHDYPRRGWAKPLLIALGIFCALMFAIFLVAVALVAAYV